MRYKLLLFSRYMLQCISLLFFVYILAQIYYPIGWQNEALQWYSRLDPWLLFIHLRWQHNVPVWIWLPFIIITITILFGRVFCGWFCPFGALLTAVDKAGRFITQMRPLKRWSSIRTKGLNRLLPMRYYWLLIVAVMFAIGSNWSLFFTPFALFSHEIARILLGEVPWLLIIIGIGTLLFSRFWCSVLCPTGLILSLMGRYRLFRYQVVGTCVHCGKCVRNCSVAAAPAETFVAKEGCLACGDCQRVCPTKAVKLRPSLKKRPKSEVISESVAVEETGKSTRRQFLKMVFTVAAIAASATVVWGKIAYSAKKVLRPPGALQNPDFSSVCNRCGRCMKVCPNKALQPMSIMAGFEGFETPYIIPREANCVLCLSCQEVCPTGAIAQVPLEKIGMGSAVIDKARCLAWNESKLCFICGEQCPVLAIVGDDQHRPEVLLDKCVGCGTCEFACPVDGEAAIRVIPK